MPKRAIGLMIALAILGGCKGKPKTAAATAVANPAPSESAVSSNDPTVTQAAEPVSVSEPVQIQYYSDPPLAGVGPSVDEAYAAIPHRRTIWDDAQSTVPAEERPYLKTVFATLDQAVRVRVAAQQTYANGQFDAADVDGEFDKLIGFVRGLSTPKTLGTYHGDILSALGSERQFFSEWKAQRDQFPFAQQVANHPGVRAASSNLRDAYNQLMSRYPQESAANKDAFFDYHCALDFL